MKKFYGVLLTLCFCLATPCITAAQDQSAAMAPPKILTVVREVVKPGKSGLAHERSESAFVKAMTAANSPQHYVALDSITGIGRSLFLTGYDSFTQWESQIRADQGNATLSAAIDHAGEVDGDLLQTYENSIYVLREDQSRAGTADLAHARYFEFEVFTIKPGHDADWDAIVKLVMPALAKANPEDHWLMYERLYGGPSTHVVLRTLASASEIDHSLAATPAFGAALGAEGGKRLSDLAAAAIETSESNLFVINPRMSYVSAELANRDAAFWKPAEKK